MRPRGERDGARTVLIVEDHERTAQLFVRAFREVRDDVECHVAATVTEAIELLASDEDPERTDLLLLDLGLAEDSGFEVLSALESADRHVPTVVVSDTTDPADVERTYRSVASSFIAKPERWEGFTDMADTLTTYWFELVTAPPAEVSTADGALTPSRE